MGKTVNVFISQPMKDKTREEIIKERYKTIAWIYEDLALDEIFLQTFKNAEFKCHQNSKYCNLAYHGYNVKKIMPRA